jgi:hypothetical protein
MESDELVALSAEFAELGRELHGPGDNQAALILGPRRTQ